MEHLHYQQVRANNLAAAKVFDYFDKVLLLMDQSIGKAVFACQGILCLSSFHR
jgi:hypothetical protein